MFVEAVAGETKTCARWLRREDLKLGHRETLVNLITKSRKIVNRGGGAQQSKVHT